MGKIKKRKTKIKVKGEWQGHAFADSYLKNVTDHMELQDEEVEGDHVIDGYKSHHRSNYNEYFNDDLGIDNQDYEVEQEKYAVESEDAQPIAVDRYFERFTKSRRTPR